MRTGFGDPAGGLWTTRMLRRTTARLPRPLRSETGIRRWARVCTLRSGQRVWLVELVDNERGKDDEGSDEEREVGRTIAYSSRYFA